jgi:hypothetical protein
MKPDQTATKGNNMKNALALVIITALAVLAPGSLLAQQVPIPTTAAQVSGPVAGTGMTKEFVQMVGRTAYFWGYPIVATSSRRDAFAKAPERIYLGGVVPMAPIGELTMLHDYISPEQTFIVCPLQTQFVSLTYDLQCCATQRKRAQFVRLEFQIRFRREGPS